MEPKMNSHRPYPDGGEGASEREREREREMASERVTTFIGTARRSGTTTKFGSNRSNSQARASVSQRTAPVKVAHRADPAPRSTPLGDREPLGLVCSPKLNEPRHHAEHRRHQEQMTVEH